MAGHSPYLQTVCTVFMALFGINFSIFYLLLLRQFSRVFRNEELRLYLLVMLSAIALITINTLPNFDGNVGEAFHHVAFTVSSIMTTTGFATVDFNLWPVFSKMLLANQPIRSMPELNLRTVQKIRCLGDGEKRCCVFAVGSFAIKTAEKPFAAIEWIKQEPARFHLPF